MIKIYKKLVRDKIPEIIAQDNEIPKTRILDDKEFVKELFKKLIEESQEAVKTNGDKQELTKEIGDIYEVLDTLIEYFNLDKQEILDLQNTRRKKRGGFKEKFFLTETETKE